MPGLRNSFIGSHPTTPTTPQIKTLDQSPWSSSPEDPDTPFNQAIRSLPTDAVDSLHTLPSDLSLRPELLQSQAPKQSTTMSSSTLPTLPSAIRLPKFDTAGRYDGKSPADRWLTQIKYDFQQNSQIPPPALYLKAVGMLFIEDAATWLANTPRMRQIIDTGNSATAAEVREFEEALRKQFPASVLKSKS